MKKVSLCRRESCAARRTRYDRVRGSDGGNDALDDALRETPGDADDVVLLRASPGRIEQPLNVLRIIVIHLLV